MAENPPPEIVEITVTLEKVTAQTLQEKINDLAALGLLQPKTKVQYVEIVLHIETDHLKYSTPDANKPKLDPKPNATTRRDALS